MFRYIPTAIIFLLLFLILVVSWFLLGRSGKSSDSILTDDDTEATLVDNLTRKQCPIRGDMKTMNPFDLSKFQGVWYTVAKLPESFLDTLTSQPHRTIEWPFGILVCENSTIRIMNETERRINISNVGYSEDFERTFSIEGVAYPEDMASPGALTLYLRYLPSSPYWILDTDYLTYALVYSCREGILKGRQDMAWFMSRTKSMEPNLMASLKFLLTTYGLDVSHVHMERQDCSPTSNDIDYEYDTD